MVNYNFDDDDDHVVQTFVLKLIRLDLKYFVSQTIMTTEESAEHLMNWWIDIEIIQNSTSLDLVSKEYMFKMLNWDKVNEWDLDHFR